MVQNGNWEWFLEGFRFDLETRVKPKTLEYYCDRIKVLSRWANEIAHISDPSALTKRDIQTFLHWVKTAIFDIHQGNGALRQTQTRSSWPYYRTLRRFFNWAVAEGYLEKSPIEGIDFRPPKHPPVEPYRQEHIQIMIKVLDHDWQVATTSTQKMLSARDRSILYLFLESGLRLSELAGLTVDDIDLNKQRVMVVNGKMDKSRVSGFGAQSKKALWRYMGLREPKQDTRNLWITEEGLPLGKNGIREIIRRLKRDAGLNHVKGSVHKLRHTFATTFLRQTRDMKGCRLLLGHSTLAMTERYTEFIEVEDALKAYDGKGPLDWLQSS